LALPPAPEACL